LTLEQKIELAPLLGSIIGFVGSDGNATNVSFGGTLALSGLKNNYLSHAQWQDLIEEFGDCNGDRECIEQTLAEYRELSNTQEAQMALCGGNIECLAPHILAVQGAAAPTSIAEINAFLGSLNPADFADTPQIGQYIEEILRTQQNSQIAAGLSDNYLTEAYIYAYSMYGTWSSSNCSGLSTADCMTKFQDEEIHNLGGYVHQYTSQQSAIAMYTLAAGGAALSVAPAALAALSRCVMNPACLANLQVGTAEGILGLTGATAGNTFVTVGAAGTAVAGRLIFQNGDEIIRIVDDIGRVFTPLSQSFDDAGRLLVRNSDGSIGYIDNVANNYSVVATGSRADLIEELATNGTNFQPENVIDAVRMPDGTIAWIDAGNANAGLMHIIDGKTTSFAGIGIEQDDILDFVLQALRDNNRVGMSAGSRPIPVYLVGNRTVGYLGNLRTAA